MTVLVVEDPRLMEATRSRKTSAGDSRQSGANGQRKAAREPDLSSILKRGSSPWEMLEIIHEQP